MLANAFNFTVGRFRRFVVRTQSSADQLEVVARQQYERSQLFMGNLQHLLGGSAPLSAGSPGAEDGYNGVENTFAQIQQARGVSRALAREGSSTHARATLDLAEQAYLSAGRVSQMVNQMALATTQGQPEQYGKQSAQLQLEELRTLGEILRRLGAEARAIQNTDGDRLAQMDAALERVGVAVRDGNAREFVGVSGSPSNPGGVNVQTMGRLASTFAQEVATLSRQVMVITQEMRAGLTSFRIESGAQPDPTLYPPGSGYRDGSSSASGPWNSSRSPYPPHQPPSGIRNAR
jgi:hypothetical protein